MICSVLATGCRVKYEMRAIGAFEMRASAWHLTAPTCRHWPPDVLHHVAIFQFTGHSSRQVDVGRVED